MSNWEYDENGETHADYLARQEEHEREMELAARAICQNCRALFGEVKPTGYECPMCGAIQ